MRRFRAKKSDSLDLLLDTLCNAFGGIVLIAILITLLTRDTRDRIEAGATSADRELIERQILSLQSDIAEANEYLERQATSVSVDPNLVARLGETKGALQTAKGNNEEAWRAWETASAKAAGDDPEADKALGEKVSIASRTSRLKTERDAQTEKLDRLKLRLETLRRERSDTIAEKSEQLRLPKEQPERGGNIFFLLKNNEIYPIRVAQNGRLVRNTDSLKWRELNADADEATPISGRGVTPDSVVRALGPTFDVMLKEGNYAALDIDSRSAEAYRALRAELLRRRIPFGWGFDDDAVQIFSSRGSKPPPL
jgi:hypothetical protein